MKIEDINKAEETKRLLHEKNYQNFTHSSPQKAQKFMQLAPHDGNNKSQLGGSRSLLNL
jgi:hypothetical protein